MAKAKTVENVGENVVEGPIGTPQVIIVTPPPPKENEFNYEGATLEEKIIKFVEKSGGQAEINPVLVKEFGPTLSLQHVAKQVKVKINAMLVEGKIKASVGHENLGKFYYEGNDPKTKYQTPANTKIFVTL